MKPSVAFLGGCLSLIGMVLVPTMVGGFAQAETTAMDKGFLRTNGDFVIIGNIAVKTNSSLNTDEFKQYMWRVHLVNQIQRSGSSNTLDRVVEAARALIQDYPKRENGYQFIMGAMEDYEWLGTPDKARFLANELAMSPGPEQFRRWAKGFLNRLDSRGKPVTLQFTAVDGRKVNLAEMRGKVVLVDFWGTHCGPCLEELPRVKQAFERFHAEGFEIIGISCDTDKNELEDCVKKRGISWPQYFDGKQQNENQLTVDFGIDGIPHMFLVDKKGYLRFDNVRARDDAHPKGDTTSFEDKVSSLLAEK